MNAPLSPRVAAGAHAGPVAGASAAAASAHALLAQAARAAAQAPAAPGLPPLDLAASALNPAQRQRDLARAQDSVADVLVIGAGVTGAGAALDAAARGLKVVLVEAGDVATGTSSRSGKTFHGGLRYLEQLNFRLVAHAIAERDLMLHTLCPHIAWPEAFVFPLGAAWERLYVGAGVTLYDLFGLRHRAVPRQRHFSRRGLKAHFPSIDDTRAAGGIQYYDALMDEARHTLAVARTAAGLGAAVISGAPVVDFLKAADGAVQGVVVRDADTGQRHTLRARAVINAGGVWADELQRLAGASTFRVQPAKGVHLLLRGEAIDAQAGILARADDSVIIARRWYGQWLVGTTDTPWDRDKGRPVAEAADVRYLLDNLNRYLSRKVTLDDVLGTFAGLRPLLKPVEGQGTTSALSRDHAVLPGPVGLTTIVGGKYTTYRRMAEDVVNAALAGPGAPPAARPCPTAQLPLLGATAWASLRDEAPRLARTLDLPEPTVRLLLGRHGDQLAAVLAHAAEQPALARPLPGAPRVLGAEVCHAVAAEGARSLEDVMVRRLHLAWELPDGGDAVAPQVAALIAPLLGWSAEQTAAQVADYRAFVAGERAALAALRAEASRPATASAA
ncbi:glycerol-3-phosphate dehydrogenase/oxidase [Ideonella livida]|uniref:Glycerol-3-phosphate dehydrogenase/oxidase n=1 Tax=Ideonella livida TaxID=2707176 RepID=A0A7C9TN60_9BURK|nr:glycerol-3-phosphate dehydrogenase/oxidase [Ideonella livida]NDY92927.1 glycerol-3-phosphate dehydrogenase/oxidase [Ideonella livida]